MPLEPDVLTTVENTAVAVEGEVPAFTAATVLDDSVSHQRAVNLIREASVAVGSRKVLEAARRRTAYETLTRAKENLTSHVAAAHMHLRSVAARLK